MFDEWVADPGASFEAVEQEGLVVGVHRLRPIAAGVAFYEGLRVAASHRRRGIGRAMLRHAVEEARGLGFKRVRLFTGNRDAGKLFQSEGFRLLFDCAVWTALRVEGGDPPRLASPGDAGPLAAMAAQDPAFAAYGGVNASWHSILDVDSDLLERLATEGLVRVGGGGRALALIREGEAMRRLAVTFLVGSGTALQDLLEELRFEADAHSLAQVAILAPEGHPAAGDIREVGYDLAEDEGHAYGYQLEL
ncbi:MAG: GNAT family N-acetyltransferase [Candidatus Dormibacteraeota bacterium]|nr:GNAT family N-acetyltransferase [Candidatus Dormibacteraeota bacterium]